MARVSKAALAKDARNRALRTFLQGLAIDVAVAVAVVVYDALRTDQPDYRLLGLSVARTVLQTAASYVMRRFADGSRLPTPLPPDPQVEPAE